MYLQFFIWGSWYATGGNFMAAHGMASVIYLAFMASSIGSIVSPFFIGKIADQLFPVQKVLGVMHLLSGAFVFCAPFFVQGSLRSVPLFLGLLLLHMLCYMPTVNLASASVFHILPDREKQFPVIRLFGTLGWISAGILVSRILHADSTSLPMHISGIVGMLTGIYSFTLPHVHPTGMSGQPGWSGLFRAKGFEAFKSSSFIIFILGLLLISLPFAIYFPYTPVFLKKAGVANPAFNMSFGQVSELFFLLALPWFLDRFGVKWVLLAGMLAWASRYALFAFAAPGSVSWMILIGILLHGCCYDFVYVASQIYIDKVATPSIRAQAQGLFVLVSYGVGQGLGTLGAGWIFNHVVTGDGNLQQWQIFWLIPLLFALVVALLFILGFREKTGIPSGRLVKTGS
jgi:nucleoside transporter